MLVKIQSLRAPLLEVLRWKFQVGLGIYSYTLPLVIPVPLVKTHTGRAQLASWETLFKNPNREASGEALDKH